MEQGSELTCPSLLISPHSYSHAVTCCEMIFLRTFSSDPCASEDGLYYQLFFLCNLCSAASEFCALLFFFVQSFEFYCLVNSFPLFGGHFQLVVCIMNSSPFGWFCVDTLCSYPSVQKYFLWLLMLFVWRRLDNCDSVLEVLAGSTPSPALTVTTALQFKFCCKKHHYCNIRPFSLNNVQIKNLKTFSWTIQMTSTRLLPQAIFFWIKIGNVQLSQKDD